MVLGREVRVLVHSAARGRAALAAAKIEGRLPVPALLPAPKPMPSRLPRLLIIRKKGAMPRQGAHLPIALNCSSIRLAAWYCGARQQDTQCSNSAQHWFFRLHLWHIQAVSTHSTRGEAHADDLVGFWNQATHVAQENCSPPVQHCVLGDSLSRSHTYPSLSAISHLHDIHHRHVCCHHTP